MWVYFHLLLAAQGRRVSVHRVSVAEVDYVFLKAILTLLFQSVLQLAIFIMHDKSLGSDILKALIHVTPCNGLLKACPLFKNVFESFPHERLCFLNTFIVKATHLHNSPTEDS